jgi:hypothetical protein
MKADGNPAPASRRRSMYFAEFRRPKRPPSHFLLGGQEKVTKEKATPGFAPAMKPRVRVGREGFLTARPCAGKNARASCARPFGRILPPAAAAQGPQKPTQKQGSPTHRGDELRSSSSSPMARVKCQCATRRRCYTARPRPLFRPLFRITHWVFASVSLVSLKRIERL